MLHWADSRQTTATAQKRMNKHTWHCCNGHDVACCLLHFTDILLSTKMTSRQTRLASVKVFKLCEGDTQVWCEGPSPVRETQHLNKNLVGVYEMEKSRSRRSDFNNSSLSTRSALSLSGWFSAVMRKWSERRHLTFWRVAVCHVCEGGSSFLLSHYLR